jgi:hypothetical protein
MATKQSLSDAQIEQWCQRARDAGAKPSDVAALREMLTTADATPVLLRTIELQLAELADRPRRYVLVSSIIRDGKLYPPPSELVLEPLEAESIVHAISTRRSAGRFRVIDPAGVDLQLEHHEPGAELELDADTADALDAAIEPVLPPPRTRRQTPRPAA